MPAITTGTIGAPVRTAMSEAPWRNVPMRPGGPLTGALGHLDEDAAVAQDCPGRRHVPVDPEPAAPDREEATDAVDQGLAPATVER